MAKAESENVSDILVGRAAVDGTAFALLYDIYYERIFSYCVGRMRLRQIAEDFTSATFLSAARNILKFRGKTRIEFANWLYAVATAKINSYLRRKQTIEKLMATEAEIQAAKAQSPQPEAVTWPMLHNAVLKLKLKEQTVITLRFLENLAIDRIAEITGMMPYAVHITITKALENIKMFDTGRQFEDTVKKLGIDNTPDAGHRERLRTKILMAFNVPDRNKYRRFLYLPAGAIILIAAGLLVWFHNFGSIPPEPRRIVKPSKRAAEVNPPQTRQLGLGQQEGKTRLEKIKQLAAEKNISELLKILESNDMTAKMLAAKYLAELTDSNATDILGLVSPTEKQADLNKPTTQKIEQRKVLPIKAIDKRTRLPLAGVSLRIYPGGQKEMVEGVTDANGQYLPSLPAEAFNQLQINAAMKGYAAMKIQQYSTVTRQETILFEMTPVMEIGGFVVDEQLKPVENAEVKVRVDWDSNSELPMVNTDEIFRTDVNGIWRCEGFPQDVCQVRIMVTHPDYTRQENYQSAIAEQLENFSYLTVLEKGIAVVGRVLDWEQKPLPATVSKGAHFESQNSATCDANGVFRFSNVSSGTEIFTAQCVGAAPQIQKADVGPNMPPIIFNLEPAKTILGKVVDINNTPLKDADVRVSSWQGFSSLNFETKTDANGFFRWTDAPADEVLFDFYKPGYMKISNFGMRSENDYVITLQAGTDET